MFYHPTSNYEIKKSENKKGAYSNLNISGCQNLGSRPITYLQQKFLMHITQCLSLNIEGHQAAKKANIVVKKPKL